MCLWLSGAAGSPRGLLRRRLATRQPSLRCWRVVHLRKFDHHRQQHHSAQQLNLSRSNFYLSRPPLRVHSLFYDDGPVSCAVLTMHTAAYDGQGPS